MAAPTYGAAGSAVATTTSCVATAPTGITAGMPLLYPVSTNGSAIGGPPAAGWFQIGATQVGGGIRKACFGKIADGTESSVAFTVSGLTGGTKGEGLIVRFNLGAVGDTVAFIDGSWVDTDTSSTALAGAGAAWTSDTNCLIFNAYTSLTTVGTYSGNATSPTIAQAGATVVTTARAAGLTGTNTIAYGHQTASVTAGGTGAPSFSATATTVTSATAAGAGSLILLQTVSPAFRAARNTGRARIIRASQY